MPSPPPPRVSSVAASFVPCVHGMRATAVPQTNRVTSPAPRVGVWGGQCTCPDGQTYLVGDRLDFCASLACVGGTAGACHRETGGGWAQRQVECGALEDPSV
eukprot:6423057-Prymnesium_polylepis.1